MRAARVSARSRVVAGDIRSSFLPSTTASAPAAVWYVEYVTGERELYDLPRDRAELHNLAATARPQLLRRLAARLARLKTCQGTECRAAEEARRVLP